MLGFRKENLLFELLFRFSLSAEWMRYSTAGPMSAGIASWEGLSGEEHERNEEEWLRTDHVNLRGPISYHALLIVVYEPGTRCPMSPSASKRAVHGHATSWNCISHASAKLGCSFGRQRVLRIVMMTMQRVPDFASGHLY